MQNPDRQKPEGQMRSHEISCPGEEVAMDLIDKIKESHAGNECIIVAVDLFTHFVEAKAVPDKGATTFMQFVVEYCGRFGISDKFRTDKSTTFCNELVSQVIKVFGA